MGGLGANKPAATRPKNGGEVRIAIIYCLWPRDAFLLAAIIEGPQCLGLKWSKTENRVKYPTSSFGEVQRTDLGLTETAQ